MAFSILDLKISGTSSPGVVRPTVDVALRGTAFELGVWATRTDWLLSVISCQKPTEARKLSCISRILVAEGGTIKRGPACLQGFRETALSFAEHGGMNVTGLSLIDFSNHTGKAFAKAWQGHDSNKWTSGSGHKRVTVSVAGRKL